MTYDGMNKLLKSELSAIETYRQALEKKDTDPEHVTAIDELNAILDALLDDHQRAASRIEAAIRRKGGEPAQSSGVWGTWSKIVMGTAQLFGDKAALKALKEGEESGLKEYEEVLGDTGIPQDQRTLISDLLATQRLHVQTLDGHATSNEVGQKGAAWAKKTGTRRTAQEAAGGWLAFRDAIVDEPPAVRIEHIRAGAQPSFLVGAAEALGVSRETIFRIVGLSVSTANRKIAKQETLDPLVTERLVRLAVIEQQASDTFGDPEVARAWLRAENVGLGGCTPLSMLDTDIGSREVAKILVAIAHGGAA